MGKWVAVIIGQVWFAAGKIIPGIVWTLLALYFNRNEGRHE